MTRIPHWHSIARLRALKTFYRTDFQQPNALRDDVARPSRLRLPRRVSDSHQHELVRVSGPWPVSPGLIPMASSRCASPEARQFANRDASLGFYRAAGEALASVPGVALRGAASALPFTASVGCGSINVEGWTPQPGQELQVDQRGATPDYFKTMRIPLRRSPPRPGTSVEAHRPADTL